MTHLRPILRAMCFCLAVNANAAPPGRHLQTACAESDAVVLGTVEPVVLTSAPAIFSLSVDTLIKGQIAKGSSVTVSWPGSLTGAKMNPGHYRAVWFLRSGKTSSTAWEIMPISGLNAPMFASGLALPPSGGDGTRFTGRSCFQAVWAALEETAPLIDQSLAYFTAMETLLREIPASDAVLTNFTSTMAGFARSPSVELRTLALASGIRRQDTGSLTQFAAEAATLSILRPRATGAAILALIGWRSTDPPGLEALGVIAHLPDWAGLGQVAAQALMMIHTKEAAPQLAKLLAAKDPQLRQTAVRGLSLFVRGAPVLDGPNVRAMAYLAEGQVSEYVDERILPYITITPAPPGREDEYVKAWQEWWGRMSHKFTR